MDVQLLCPSGLAGINALGGDTWKEGIKMVGNIAYKAFSIASMESNFAKSAEQILGEEARFQRKWLCEQSIDKRLFSRGERKD